MSPRTIERMALERESPLDDTLAIEETGDDAFDNEPLADRLPPDDDFLDEMNLPDDW